MMWLFTMVERYRKTRRVVLFFINKIYKNCKIMKKFEKKPEFTYYEKD